MKDASTSTRNGMAGRRLVYLFVLMLAFSASVGAQSSSTTSGTTPLGMAPGAPAGSYALSGFETVNPYNGALNLRLPLLHVGGRGGVGHTIQFTAEQHWRVEKQDTSGVGYLLRPDPNRWSTIDPGFSPGTMVGRRTGISQSQGIEVYCPDNGIALTRFTFTAADGTEYEFRDVQTNGTPMDNVYQLDPNNEFICNLVTTHPRGRVFVTSDGSAATFISDQEINDHSDGTDPYSSLPGELAYPTGYLFMRDGTCYRIDGGKVLWIRDRNGNRITFQYEYIDPNWRTTITDSLNRVVVIDSRLHDPVRNKDYDLIAYKGFGGAARTIKLWYSKLKNALRPDFGLEAMTYEFLFPDLNGSADNPYNPPVVSEIELPDGRTYQLMYNWYGELARVDLPTGGRIEYDYDAGVTGDNKKGVITRLGKTHIYRRVTERRVYKDAGTTFESKETYSRPENSSDVNQGYVEVQHLAADGATILAREKHYYFGSPKSSFFKEPHQYSNWKDGKEYKTEYYEKGTPSIVPLRTVENTWQQPTGSATWPLTEQGETNETAKPNQPQITAVTTTLSDTNQASKQTFTYDQYTNKTEVKEYDLGPSAPGSLVRRTATSYLTNNLSVNYTTVNPNTTNPDPNGTVHIRSLPLQESVYDNGNAERARTTYEYDNYTGVLWDRSDITGHARMLGAQATHTATYLTRGNATQVTRVVLGTPEVLLSTRMEYDIAGNVRSVTDPKATTTTVEFDDRFGTPDDEAQGNTQAPTELGSLHTYAFATKVTNALLHVVYTQYDYYLGKPVNGEDANGAVAKGSYDDALDRGTELEVGIFTESELRRRTQFIYDDPAKTITTQSDQTTYDDQALKTVSLYDGLGRTFETRSYETENAYITTKQEFDGLGRVKRSYNPFRTASDDTYGYADTTYDGLGRVTRVETFNGSVSSSGSVVTAYSGNATTVTDQAGKKRRSITDGLGRLIRVDEPDSNGNLDNTAVPPQPLQPTSYIYDVLDDLVKVTQGGQTRFFTYDSLKRLIRARNPEQDINTNLSPAITDPVTSNSQWCVKYVYDANSNLFTKTDARDITTTYAYDGLNRVTGRTYTNDTPAVSYKYDAQTLPAGFPSTFDRGFSTGRLVAVTYGGTSAGNYTGYDQLGRVTSSYQQTDSQNYGFTYGYDLAGEMLTETYPSGRAITNAYDLAGRLTSVNGHKTSESDKTYASQYSYAAHGAVASMQLGNGKWEHTAFNNRLQPTLIGLGTSSTDSSILRLDYGYGTTSNNGNVLTQKITAPGLTLNQCYGYDTLNRLSTAEERSGGTNCAGPQQWKQAFSYDRYGNRNFDVGNTTPNVFVGVNPTINQATNRFAAGQSYGYDGAGNLASDPATSANGIVYDAENRQTQYTKTGQQTNYYYYDGDGNRVKKIDNSGATVFVYNAGGQLIAEYTSGTPSGGGTSYLTSDHLGSTRVVMKQDGSVARHDFLPFGEEIQAGVGGRTAGLGYVADKLRQKFTQKERDSESGLDYFLARYYSSAQGRFTSADEFIGGPDELFDFSGAASSNPTFYADLTDPQSLNKYQYCYNNPLLYIDPDGHQGVRKWVQDTLRGAAAAFNADNGLPTPSGDQTTTGRVIGHGAAILQGVTEVVTGGNMIAGGGAEAVVTSPAATTVVGAVVPAAGVGVAVAGGALVAHGGGVLINTAKNIVNEEPARTQGGALTEPTKPPKTVVDQQGVKIHWNTGDHGPAHLHVNGGGPFTRIGQNGKPLRHNPELSGTQQAVVKENIKTIRNTVDKIQRLFKFIRESR